jgi:PBSX family phage terminase large subunit
MKLQRVELMQCFKKTNKQVEAINILASDKKNIMLYGGSRSGKTFIICYSMIVRAIKEKSRHAILRLKFNHAKTSIWLDTLPKVLDICFPDLKPHIKPNSSDYYFKFPNGSEIWVAGLDDKQRTEKILGKEYSTIFFNECSQIPFGSVNMALTRLAEKNGLLKRAYYDENPPQKSHWSYSIFILNKDPDTWEDRDANKYCSLLMNPDDNIENIDEDYINEVLDVLPPRERQRFREGIFQDAAEGAIYYAFDRTKHIKELPDPRTPIKFGCDFNVNPITAVAGYFQNGIIYITGEIYMQNSNTYKLADEMKRRWGLSQVWPDATGKARKSSSVRTDHQILVDAGYKVQYNPNPHVKDRHNCINGLLSNNRLYISQNCRWLIKDLEQLTHDSQDPMLSHISDAMGYLCWGLAPLQSNNKLRVESYA